MFSVLDMINKVQRMTRNSLCMENTLFFFRQVNGLKLIAKQSKQIQVLKSVRIEIKLYKGVRYSYSAMDLNCSKY